MISGAVVVALAGGAIVSGIAREDARPGEPPSVRCNAPAWLVRRVQRGYAPRRSGDVLMVEARPHQIGTRHSSPYPYTQNVPVVLYGPGYIRSGVDSSRRVTLAGLAPTYAELMGFDAFPRRTGRVLEEALLPAGERQRPPRLIVTVVWDGGGRNVLEQWPDAWPVLERIVAEGTSYRKATVGSSPSITPAVHATIGTGAFPQTHGITEIEVRAANGRIVDSWEDSSPRLLKIPTLADLWDAANDNAPVVGLVARDEWHLGMMGHGSYLSGADEDIAVLDDLESAEFRGLPSFFSFPSFVEDPDGLQAAISRVDRRDGQLDESWMENEMLVMDENVRLTPAWSIYQTQRIIELLQREGFGTDPMTDLFFTNYKPTDLAGHQWNMIDPEVRSNLYEQDRQLGVLIRALDELVGPRRYVIALTADHGMTPSTSVTGGWSINLTEMTADLEAALDSVDNDHALVIKNRGFQLFLNHAELARNELTADDVAEFVRDYRVEDNARGEELGKGRFTGPPSTRLFSLALTPDELPEALSCAKEQDR